MYQKGQYSKAFTKSGSTLKSSQKWLSQQIVNSFINSLTALTAKYKSAKVRKAPVIFQNVQTQTQFVPLYRIKVDKPNTKKWNVQNSFDRFVSIQKKKRKNRRTAGVIPHDRKAKGSDSAFKEQAHHALDGNRSWFGHLA